MHPRTIQGQINTLFSEKIELIGFYQYDALLEIRGPMPISENVRAASEIELARLHLLAKQNESHTIVIGYKNRPPHNIQLQLHTLDFSNICAMRMAGEKPAVLTASAILICGETEELIVHQRSATVATHPHHWHIFGGAFNPAIDSLSNQVSLRHTLQREIFEETGLSCSIPKNSAFTLCKEKTTGFIQWCLLGLPVEVTQLEQLQDNWEGSIHRLPFNQLGNFLQEENWVASGKANILSWLALDAPHSKPNQKFGPYTALQLFDHLIKQESPHLFNDT